MEAEGHMQMLLMPLISHSIYSAAEVAGAAAT